jgi:hypothetical protein
MCHQWIYHYICWYRWITQFKFIRVIFIGGFVGSPTNLWYVRRFTPTNKSLIPVVCYLKDDDMEWCKPMNESLIPVVCYLKDDSWNDISLICASFLSVLLHYLRDTIQLYHFLVPHSLKSCAFSCNQKTDSDYTANEKTPNSPKTS